MGAELLESHPDVYSRYLGAADAAAGKPVRSLSLDGPIEALTSTDVAQPALCALSLALTEIAAEAGLRPDFVAGHSLGEYTAAIAAGVLSYAEGIRLVAERGRQMAGIQAERPGAMAAVMGLAADALIAVCERASAEGLVTVANLNTPDQVVISGEAAGVEAAGRLAKEAGAGRVIPLQVGAAFHSPLMAPVQERLRPALDACTWRDPRVPLAANASGRMLRTAGEVKQGLIDQIASTVRWVECVQALAGAGCDLFVEIGPGRVLSGLVRQIVPGAKTVAADNAAKIDALLEAETGARRT